MLGEATSVNPNICRCALEDAPNGVSRLGGTCATESSKEVARVKEWAEGEKGGSLGLEEELGLLRKGKEPRLEANGEGMGVSSGRKLRPSGCGRSDMVKGGRGGGGGREAMRCSDWLGPPRPPVMRCKAGMVVGFGRDWDRSW